MGQAIRQKPNKMDKRNQTRKDAIKENNTENKNKTKQNKNTLGTAA